MFYITHFLNWSNLGWNIWSSWPPLTYLWLKLWHPDHFFQTLKINFFQTTNMVLIAGNHKRNINKLEHLNHKLEHLNHKFKCRNRMHRSNIEAISVAHAAESDKSVTSHHSLLHLNSCHTVVIIIIITRPWPAFGRLGLGGSSGGYSSHGLTSNASLRACGAQLGGKSTCQWWSSL